MAKIPATAMKDVPQKCLICGKKFKNKASLVDHIGKKHKDQIPEGWSPSRYENYLRSGKDHGTCVVCKEPTEWNESTWKYNRLCENKKCRQEIADTAEKNCKAALGKGRKELLNDPEFQRKMIYSKKNSGKYEWTSDEGKYCENWYDSSVSKQFLEMIDVFLNLDPRDVFSPSPNTYPYKYEGKTHQYIPDHYIASLNLEVEIKEPKDNQNMHPKIQAVDKVKEQIKDEVMAKKPNVNYIKINGNDYTDFFALLNYLKSQDDVTPVASKSVHYSVRESIMEEFSEFESILERKSVTLKDMEKLNRQLKNALDVENPKFTYKQTRTRILKQLKDCETIEDCEKLNNELTVLRAHLELQSTRDREKDRMKYEADETIKFLDERVIPALDDKMEKLIRKQQKEATTESTYVKAIKDNKEYKPVYVFLSFTGSPLGKVIKQFTGDQFSHASLSLDDTLRDMVSFGTRRDGKLGFVPDESIDMSGYHRIDDANCALYMYMADQEEYSIIQNMIKQFKAKGDKLKYSWRGLMNISIGRTTRYTTEYFCSEFVASVLGAANPEILEKDPSLYTPGDLSRVSKFIKIYDGLIKDYDIKRTDKTIRTILGKGGFEHVHMEK